MKILFSPSKEMRTTKPTDLNLDKLKYKNIIFKGKTFELIDILKKIPENDIAKLMAIKNSLLEKTINNIKNYENLDSIPAIYMYNGVAYKNVELSSYNLENLTFMDDNLFILSALYGLVSPLTLIKNYRLDMNMKFPKLNLYKFWKEDINKFLITSLKEDEILLNLASKEFSKLIDRKTIKNIIDIDFKDFRDEKYKSISSYVKQARGSFLNEIINNKSISITEIKNLSVNGYTLNKELSNKNSFVYTR